MLTKYVSEYIVPMPAWLGGGNWNFSQLTPVTILFGKNGSGKSLLLRAWRNGDNQHCHYVVPERTGTLDFEANLLQGQLDSRERQNQTSGNSITNYRQLIISRIQAYFLARGDSRKEQLPGDPAKLETFLSKLFPDFSIELKALKNPPYLLTRTSSNQLVKNINELSSGEAQLITIALDVLTIAAIWDIQNTPTRILLIDEPDAHIHPDLQVRFADFMIDVAKHYKLQLVIATHSTTLLAAIGQFGAQDTSVIFLQQQKQNFVAEAFTDIHKELTACLGGHALMGPLFGAPLLLVEGDDDYRIWSQVPRHHKINLSVIPCKGGDEVKRYQKSLEKIFSSLRLDASPLAGYALLDGDQALPEVNEGSPQNHIKFIRLACREAENLFLTDAVLLLLGTDWPTASSKIVKEAEKYGIKKESLILAATWDRKNRDVKNLINQVTQILDPKNVHWTIRVANALGKSRPESELADFLGKDVVNALWGALPNPQV